MLRLATQFVLSVDLSVRWVSLRISSPDKQIVKAKVSMFSRDTPVELEDSRRWESLTNWEL